MNKATQIQHNYLSQKIFYGLLISILIGLFILYKLAAHKQQIETVQKAYNFYKELDCYSDIYERIKQDYLKQDGGQTLENEIEKAKGKLSSTDYRAAKSTYDEMIKHQKKLDEYRQNPDKYDNKDLLKNTNNEEIRQQIINGRIKHLENEIKTFYNNIVKILQKTR